LAVLTDFDFLAGHWRVNHRRKRRDGAGWETFEGTASHRAVLGGTANVEEHALDAPGGAYRAVALRAYDETSGRWAIWWLDSRSPAGPLDPPVIGGFDGGVGLFYSASVDRGKPERVRFRWSDITPASARWEQSFSSDGGQTWQLDWVMSFQRQDRHPAPATREPGRPADFAFLRGEWRVEHRFRRAPDTDDWLLADGTASHSVLIGGMANMDEYVINAPSGTHRALALRSYDATAKEWAIWWLDARAPLGPLDPPTRGSFTGGVGTFHGVDATPDGPVRVRFIWSDVTDSSARWEQAYSSTPDTRWQTNWIMDFRRIGR
jgi:hypothetical protein